MASLGECFSYGINKLLILIDLEKLASHCFREKIKLLSSFTLGKEFPHQHQSGSLNIISLVTKKMFVRGANSKWRVVAGKTRIGKGTRSLLGKLRSNNGPVRQVRPNQVPRPTFKSVGKLD